VPEAVKKRRNNDLLTVQNANSLADHRAQIGKTVEVLVEGPSRLGARTTDPVRQFTGRAMTDHIVVFDGTDRLTGQTVRVRVDDASAFTLYGRVQTGEHVGDASGFAYTPDKGRRTADAEETPAYPVPLDFAPPAEPAATPAEPGTPGTRIGLPVV
jgi:hypothetical protein